MNASSIFPYFRRHALGVALVAALFAFQFGTVSACQLCTPFPRASAADYLLSAEAVVLARENPDRAFSLATVEVLKGDPGDEKIDLFLNSTTRRVLATHTDRALVLALMRLECGAAEWRRVGLADDDFGPVVRRILAAGKAWGDNPGLRFDFFAKRLGHSSKQVRDLAHIEVARAPYRRILECRDVLSREEIYSFLGNVRYISWHPLYILLLAAKDHPDDHERIRKSFYSSVRFSSTTTLQAWTAAYIEIDEAKAVEAVEKHFFRSSDRTPEELKAVLQALSVHGTNGHVHLRSKILSAYGVLLEEYPERAADILKDLQAWKTTDLRPRIAAIAADPPSGMDVEAQRKLRKFLLLQMRGGLRTARTPLGP